jgi:hypothetical protein
MGGGEHGVWMNPLRHTCEAHSLWAQTQALGMNPLSSARQCIGFLKGR